MGHGHKHDVKLGGQEKVGDGTNVVHVEREDSHAPVTTPSICYGCLTTEGQTIHLQENVIPPVVIHWQYCRQVSGAHVSTNR